MTNLTHPAEVEAILTYVLEQDEISIIADVLNEIIVAVAHHVAPGTDELYQYELGKEATSLLAGNENILFWGHNKSPEEIRTALEKARDMARKEME